MWIIKNMHALSFTFISCHCFQSTFPHTYQLIKTSICDGIIAPGYEPEALTILQAKKKGAFIVLQADPSYTPPDVEYRLSCSEYLVHFRYLE